MIKKLGLSALGTSTATAEDFTPMFTTTLKISRETTPKFIEHV